MAVKANTAPPTTLAPVLARFFFYHTSHLGASSSPRQSRRQKANANSLCQVSRSGSTDATRVCVRSCCVCERSTTEGLVLSGNKDMIKSCLETDATRERLKNRFSCFFWSLFNQARGLLLSGAPARCNCVTDISYTRFLTSVHLTIQPARRYRTPRPAFPTPQGSVPDAHLVRPG